MPRLIPGRKISWEVGLPVKAIQSKPLQGLGRVDTSVGTVSMVYSVDIPRCWRDRVGMVQMITLMQQVEISVQWLCSLQYFK